MPNPFGLHFDGDLRRIYEVPENSSFSVDGFGRRIYVPDDVGAANTAAAITTTELWSRWVEYHNAEKWTSLALQKTGGAFRFNDGQGNPVFQTFDLRLLNGWLLVPADYPHSFTVLGNLFEDLSSGEIFDDAHTSGGVSPRTFGADSLQTSQVATSDGATILARLNDVWRRLGLDPDNPTDHNANYVRVPSDGSLLNLTTVEEEPGVVRVRRLEP